MVKSSLDDLNEGIRKIDERIWDICNDILRWETGDNQLEEVCDRLSVEEKIHDIIDNLKADIINESRRKYIFEKERETNIEQMKRYEAEIESSKLNAEYLGKEIFEKKRLKQKINCSLSSYFIKSLIDYLYFFPPK